jgi:Protein of unknown function (DUF2281)
LIRDKEVTMSTETIEQSVLEKLRALPPEKQQEVLDFVEFLERKTAAKQPRRSLMGALSDLNIHITEEDIAEARREMWGNFPREGPK